MTSTTDGEVIVCTSLRVALAEPMKAEYRVVWKREGLRRKSRRFLYLPTAEKHVARLTDPNLDPHYRCPDEGPHERRIAVDDSEPTCLPPIVEGPVIEQRTVYPWTPLVMGPGSGDRDAGVDALVSEERR